MVVGQECTTPGMIWSSPRGVPMAEHESSHRLLAQNLKRIRNLTGLSQNKLAEKCDLSTNFISELEGEKVWVSADTLDRIASALGIRAYTLFIPSDLPQTSFQELLLKSVRIFEEGSARALVEIKAELAKITGERLV